MDDVGWEGFGISRLVLSGAGSQLDPRSRSAHHTLIAHMGNPMHVSLGK